MIIRVILVVSVIRKTDFLIFLFYDSFFNHNCTKPLKNSTRLLIISIVLKVKTREHKTINNFF